VEQHTIEANRDRVSVVQYSREAEVHFYLNSYTTKEEVLDRVRGLRHKGGRPLYTGAALQYVRDNVFTAPSGSRRLEGLIKDVLRVTRKDNHLTVCLLLQPVY